MEKQDSWAGFSARSLADYITKHDPTIPIDPIATSKKTLTRDDLYAATLAIDKKNNLDFIVDVLSWGGVNRSHAAKALSPEYRQAIIDIVGSLRLNRIASKDAYGKFYNLRMHNQMPGLGPAYYTKLIFFAHPNHDGFIMDQWTARSINLLLGKPLVKTTKYSTSQLVHDKNNSDVYAEFCDAIRKLTSLTGLRDPKITEEALFSGGGKKPLEWRTYVKNQT